MSVDIIMPELGESVHEGTVSRWLKKEGDSVKEDEPVVEIMTDKVNTELPSPATGMLKKILIPEGGQVAVFKPMGTIETEEEATTGAPQIKPAEEAKTPQKAQPKETPQEKAKAPASKEQATKPEEHKWYTPVVRSMAKKHDISEEQLATIQGSGEGGRVTKKDLENYITVPTPQARPTVTLEPKAVVPSAAEGVETIPLTGMRKMISDAVTRSAQVPVVSTLAEVDVTSMITFRDRNKEGFQKQFGVKLTYTPFFIKALAEALQEFPYVNSSLQDNQIIVNKAVHIGVAIALGPKGDQGLIVPVIRDCHKKHLVEIAKDLESFAAKARSNSLNVSDVQGGTFTLTNPGSYGGILGTPMINAPQAAILGTYAIRKVPVIVEDMIAIRSMMNLVLTYDHRIIDGMLAGKFLQTLKKNLETFDFFK